MDSCIIWIKHEFRNIKYANREMCDTNSTHHDWWKRSNHGKWGNESSRQPGQTDMRKANRRRDACTEDEARTHPLVQPFAEHCMKLCKRIAMYFMHTRLNGKLRDWIDLIMKATKQVNPFHRVYENFLIYFGKTNFNEKATKISQSNQSRSIGNWSVFI